MAGLLASLMGTGAEAVAKQQALINAKKGKNNEQKDIIDFFAADYAQKGCGCLGGGSKTMTVAEYTAKVQDRCKSLNLRARAMEKLGIDESQVADVDPIFLYNFVYDTSDNDLYWKFENSTVVTSKYTVTWIFFSATQMYAYTYIFDMTSDSTTEYMKEFFLQDITSFETESDLVEKIETSMVSGCMKSNETVSKNNYTVDWFRVIVPGNQFSISMRNAGTQAQSVQAAKALLRDRKFEK